MTSSSSSASRVFELFTAHWNSALLAAGVELGVFDALAMGAMTIEELAAARGMSNRAAQALLDGLVGIGALTLSDRRYANAPDSAKHLVSAGPEFLGTFARMVFGVGSGALAQWGQLDEALRAGVPVPTGAATSADDPFWPELARALVPVSSEAAHLGAALLRLDAGSQFEALDVGGGAAAYALAWLPACPLGRITQIDWPSVNAVARAEVARCGLIDRFTTIDGNFHTLDWGDARYDLVILSNIAHQESRERNQELVHKARRALKRGGRVMLSEFVLRDDRSGPPFALRFAAGAILQTEGGECYCESDFRGWFANAGFAHVEIDWGHPLFTVMTASLD